VISPVAIGEDSEPLNIDGDRAASSLASGISADSVIFFTNVEGLMLDGKLVERMSISEASARLKDIGFGMQKKVIASIDAVRAGVREALICSGTREMPVSNALAHSGCTVIA
jgi:acetylglutamate/LysW-gamma-L-alpha-aminoadipate kinase